MDQKRGGVSIRNPYCVLAIRPVLLGWLGWPGNTTTITTTTTATDRGGYQYETRIGNTPCTGGWPAVGRRLGGWPAVGRLGPEY